MTIDELLSTRRVVVCCGSGGVGKTTTSAALALRAAVLGRRAVVITIDPAKRLATSLGLKALSATAADLTEIVNKERVLEGTPPLRGKLFAVMPDTAQTFENFVRTMAGDDEGLAKRILRTSIYKIFAKEFSGANEYMAMEKLFQVYSEHKYDLVVLDTPPSANTQIFLEAPRMLAEFFDDRIMKWFIAPGSKLLAAGLKVVLELLEKLTGHGFISDLIEFTAALFELKSQFMENLHAVAGLLHQDDVAFLMVTTPERLSKSDTQMFVRLLKERGYRLWGFVVNRVLSRRLGIAIDGRIDLKTFPGHEYDPLRDNFKILAPMLEQERNAARFLKNLAGTSSSVAFIPEQLTDVHSVKSLLSVSEQFEAT